MGLQPISNKPNPIYPRETQPVILYDANGNVISSTNPLAVTGAVTLTDASGVLANGSAAAIDAAWRTRQLVALAAAAPDQMNGTGFVPIEVLQFG